LPPNTCPTSDTTLQGYTSSHHDVRRDGPSIPDKPCIAPYCQRWMDVGEFVIGCGDGISPPGHTKSSLSQGDPALNRWPALSARGASPPAIRGFTVGRTSRVSRGRAGANQGRRRRANNSTEREKDLSPSPVDRVPPTQGREPATSCPLASPPAIRCRSWRELRGL
jgi:hypothetical protein